MRKPDIIIASLKGTRRNQLFVHSTESFDEQGKFAYDLVKQFAGAMVPAGETSNGHVNLRPLTEHEVVEKATTVAKLFFEEIERLGWTLKYPSYAEMEDYKTDDALNGPVGFGL
jgi:hypothetical protein